MKEKVNVTGVPETMVQTLYARAKETKKQNAKIKDEIAVELVEKLDYDFSIADKDNAMNYGVIARTIVLDRMVEQYLKKHENTVVVNIACGLDTRCYRMKGKYLHWYNVDLPETMKIRRQFLPETGPIYQIAKSAMDDSYVDDIEYHGENVLVVIEGLTMYLCEKDIRKMFSIIERLFQKVTVMGDIRRLILRLLWLPRNADSAAFGRCLFISIAVLPLKICQPKVNIFIIR
mgnify:CR=1 FL=1